MKNGGFQLEAGAIARAAPCSPDKPGNLEFSRAGFVAALRRRGVTTLVVTGGETGVCVLGTGCKRSTLAFASCRRQMPCAAPRDGAHDAIVDLLRTRFASQVEATTTEDLLRRR